MNSILGKRKRAEDDGLSEPRQPALVVVSRPPMKVLRIEKGETVDAYLPDGEENCNAMQWVEATICVVNPDRILLHVSRKGAIWIDRQNTQIAALGTHTQQKCC